MGDAAEKKKRPAGHLSGMEVLAGLAVGGAGIWFASSSGSGGQAVTAQPSPYMAFVQCQGFVKAGLRAPASAQFPSKPLAALDTGGGVYLVTAHVDAQNSFGAMLRNDWACKVQYAGGHPGASSSWRLLDLTMGRP